MRTRRISARAKESYYEVSSMELERQMTSEELKSSTVTQSYFGRLIGITRPRVKQLIDAGLLPTCDGRIKLLEGLRRWYEYQCDKGFSTVAIYVRRHGGK